ncbi:MAG: division plane positioning ATPase MipZ [Pirellulaceae bacterium]
MSTFDRAFIRAYAKEVDLHGGAEVDVYAPPRIEESHTGSEAAAQVPRGHWAADQLYAEGAWYRIEPQQAQAPPPHVPPSWFAAPRSAAARGNAKPAPVSTEPLSNSQQPVEDDADRHAATESRAVDNAFDADTTRGDETEGASAAETERQRELIATLEFTSQFVIAASVDWPAAAEQTLKSIDREASAAEAIETAKGLESPSDVEQIPAASASQTAVPHASTTPLQAKPTGGAPSSSVQSSSVQSLGAASQPASATDKPTASQSSLPHSISKQPAAHGVPAEQAETESFAAGESSQESARLDASSPSIPTPHFSLAATTGGRASAPGAGAFTHAAEADAVEADAVEADGVSDKPQRPEAQRQQAKQERPQSPALAPSNSFSPAWEVDAFAWPELTDRLLRRETVRFMQLGERLAAAADEGRNVVAVTSPERRQGRSTLSLCLARRLAADGKRVALVDADFVNPQLAQQLRLNPTCGWQDTVGTDLSLSEAAVMSLRDAVTLFPLRVASVDRADDALDMADVAEVIDRLSRSFDVVVLDMEPVEPLDELPTQSASLHPAVIGLLVYNAASSSDQLAETVLQLRAVGIETLGAVENQAQQPAEV